LALHFPHLASMAGRDGGKRLIVPHLLQTTRFSRDPLIKIFRACAGQATWPSHAAFFFLDRYEGNIVNIHATSRHADVGTGSPNRRVPCLHTFLVSRIACRNALGSCLHLCCGGGRGRGAWPLQSIKTAPSAVIVTMRMTALVFVILIIYRIDGAA
jgi:hypothetical protein